MTALITMFYLLAGEVAVLDLGPMVGHVGPHEARIWAKASRKAALAVRVGEQADLRDGRYVAGPTLVQESAFMGHVRITGLEPSKRYYYSVLLDRTPATARPLPSFVTAPAPEARGKLRFAFSSCVGRKGADSAAAWGDMAVRAPFDLLLLLGDNQYADTTNPEDQRAAYDSHRRPAGYRDITLRTPTYAIWDDHDFGANNSSGIQIGKERSLRTFQEHFANPSYGERDNPGVYFKFSRSGVDFFMLDVRYHRSPSGSSGDGTKTLLGARQLDWLERELLASKAAVKVLASGSEWQTHTHQDCWRHAMQERDEIFRFIEDNAIKGVVLLSGDRHFTAGYQVKGRFIEITSGPLGSTNYPSKNLPEMFFNFGEGKMWSIIETDTSVSPPAVTLEVYRASEGRILRRVLTWDELNGVAKIPSLAPGVPIVEPEPGVASARSRNVQSPEVHPDQ